MISIGYFGVIEYKIRLVPLEPPILIVSVTITPILYMLVQQYTSQWRSYALWASIGTAVLAFGLFPLYSLMGILQLHRWNYFYEFILMFTAGIVARVLLLWVISIEQSQPTSSRVSSVFSGLQPVATKPLDNENTTDKND
jgi:putative effector of murein hydrolase